MRSKKVALVVIEATLEFDDDGEKEPQDYIDMSIESLKKGNFSALNFNVLFDEYDYE